jgi:hypothetical protein
LKWLLSSLKEPSRRERERERERRGKGRKNEGHRRPKQRLENNYIRAI